ncbi:MAG: DUF1566 domain-containing protein, partial [Armatimonadota bacterium]
MMKKTSVRPFSGWSRRGKGLLTLMVSALCVEGAMAYLQIAYSVNPCKFEDATRFVTTNGGCKDVRTGRVWSRNVGSLERANTYSTFSYAQSYCSNLVEGGYGDWRLPTKTEMTTVAANGAGTYLDVFWLGGGSTQPPSESNISRWSSTTVKGGKYAYVVALVSGAAESNG